MNGREKEGETERAGIDVSGCCCCVLDVLQKSAFSFSLLSLSFLSVVGPIVLMKFQLGNCISFDQPIDAQISSIKAITAFKTSKKDGIEPHLSHFSLNLLMK